MSFEFVEAEPVAQTGSGRKAEPNPFIDVINSIANKIDEKTGKPVARKFSLTVHTDGSEEAERSVNTLYGRVRRQMSEAGAAVTPPVTVRIHMGELDPVKGKKDEYSVPVTFWTVKRQSRPRTASPTDQNSAQN